LKGIKIKRFVLASTIGAVDRNPSDSCEKPLDENVNPYPLSEYGKSKLKAEQAVIESGYNYTIIRIPWAFGEYMTPDTHVRKLMQSVKDKKIFSLFDFPGKVSVVTASDLVRAFSFLAINEFAKNEIYFVTDGTPISLGNLFKTMGESIGVRAGFIPIPKFISTVARRMRPIFPLPIQNLNSDVLTASNGKITSLGFKTVLSKKEGLQILSKSMGLPYVELNSDQRLVSLVTGAASGIGKEITKELNSLGHNLLLVDIDQEELMKVASEYSAIPLTLDLTKEESYQLLYEFIISNKYRLDWVVNNAGIGIKGKFCDLGYKEQIKIIDLNCIAPVFISKLACEHFKKSRKGTLINIVSSSAFQPLPTMAVYTASKSFLLSLSRSIKGELLSIKDIKIVTAIPSGTETGFQNRAGVKKSRSERLLKPGKVAHKVIQAALKNKEEIIIGNSGKIMSILSKIIPSKLQIRLWSKLMGKMR